VAVAGLNSTAADGFSDDNKTLLGSEVDIARLVADSLGLELNVVPTSWETGRWAWPPGNTMPPSATSPSPKSAKRSLILPPTAKIPGFYVKSTSPIKSLQKAEDIAGLRIIVGSGTNQEAILLAWNAENLKRPEAFTRSTPKTMRRKPWRCSQGARMPSLART
jgi:polar amino acid transport system substrate-binding protein